jgi:hypothetical protein
MHSTEKARTSMGMARTANEGYAQVWGWCTWHRWGIHGREEGAQHKGGVHKGWKGTHCKEGQGKACVQHQSHKMQRPFFSISTNFEETNQVPKLG